MKKVVVLLFALLLVFSFVGCVEGKFEEKAPTTAVENTEEAKEDFIKITATEEKDGVLKVTVEYCLISCPKGELMIGSKNPEDGNYSMFSTDVYVEKGTGVYTFELETDLLLSRDIYVNLSEYPHPSEWTVLAFDMHTLEEG